MGSWRKREREKEQMESTDVGEQMRQKKREASGKESSIHRREEKGKGVGRKVSGKRGKNES